MQPCPGKATRGRGIEVLSQIGSATPPPFPRQRIRDSPPNWRMRRGGIPSKGDFERRFWVRCEKVHGLSAALDDPASGCALFVFNCQLVGRADVPSRVKLGSGITLCARFEAGSKDRALPSASRSGNVLNLGRLVFANIPPPGMRGLGRQPVTCPALHRRPLSS